MLDIRGNVQTRIRKLMDDNLDAVVLAAAGMHRLGSADKSANTSTRKSVCRPSVKVL